VDAQPAPGEHRAPDLDHGRAGQLLGDLPAREEVGLRVDEQPLGHAGRGVPVALGQRVDHLEHRGGERRAEPERLRATPRPGDQQGERLVVVQPGELGPEPGQQREPAVPAALGVHRDTRRRQCVDVAQHRAGRHLELARERVRRQPAALAQQQHQRDQPVGTHTSNSTEIRDTGCRDFRAGSGRTPPNATNGADMAMERTAINPVTWSADLGFNQGEVVSGHNRTLYCSG
jgi:hypothetical protein